MNKSLVVVAALLVWATAGGAIPAAPIGVDGFNPLRRGTLAAGEDTVFPVQLQAGVYYAISGWCDEICDLVVREPQTGKSLGYDRRQDAIAVVPFVPKRSARFDVAVSCPTDACRWEVRTEETRTGELREGEQASIPVVLQDGVKYLLDAVCDFDCRRLAVELRGPDSTTVAEDRDSFNVLFLPFQPQEGGEFTLIVEMAECPVEPCQWSVSVSEDMRSRTNRN